MDTVKMLSSVPPVLPAGGTADLPFVGEPVSASPGAGEVEATAGDAEAEAEAEAAAAAAAAV